MASVLSATAKNGWEGGARRGVKLAVAMGSQPLAEHASAPRTVNLDTDIVMFD